MHFKGNERAITILSYLPTSTNSKAGNSLPGQD